VNATASDTDGGVPRIAARKYALVLRPDQARPSTLVMKLRANAFRVAVTSQPDAALEAIDRMPWLSLLVAQEPVDEQASTALVEAVRDSHPELPILWIRSTSDAAVPDRVAIADGRDVIEKAEALLGQRFYPAFMIDTVASALVATLGDQFRTEAELLCVSLKLTRNPLGDVVPMLPVHGTGVAGHLVLGTSKAQLRRIHQRVLPAQGRLTVRELGDLGGELLNQTAGRIKAGLGRFGLIQLGLPVVVTGKNLTLRSPRAAPALIFDFAVFGRHLFLELSLSTMDLTETTEPAHREVLGAGELSFF
jgi:CheY-specific phosphatase CheX